MTGSYHSYKNVWRLFIPTKICFGPGSRHDIAKLCSDRRLLIVSTKGGRSRIEKDNLFSCFESADHAAWIDDVSSNPGFDDLKRQAQHCSGDYDLIVGIGGGSVLDTAKTLAVLLKTPQGCTVLDLITHTDRLDLVNPIPLAAIPTTLGTGSEVTPFATIWDNNAHQKFSLSGEKIYPAYAFVDPDLTHGLSQDMIISTGLDAINQAFESIWNKNANKLTFILAAEAINLGMNALPRLVDSMNIDTLHLRASMAEASLLAGMAISQTRTALCHSISYPLTAYFNIPHGLACAFTMSAVMRLNLRADDGRFQELAEALGYNDIASLTGSVDDLLKHFNIQKKIKEIIGAKTSLLALADKMNTSGRADNNLHHVDESIIQSVLNEAWG